MEMLRGEGLLLCEVIRSWGRGAVVAWVVGFGALVCTRGCLVA